MHSARLSVTLEMGARPQSIPRTAVRGFRVEAARSLLSRSGDPKGRQLMDLAIWLPGMFLLGLLTMAAMFAFLVGCDKV
jgi:hypothetical protein